MGRRGQRQPKHHQRHQRCLTTDTEERDVITSKAEKDRIRQRTADSRRADKAIAYAAREAVVSYLNGRPAYACMQDLVALARGGK